MPTEHISAARYRQTMAGPLVAAEEKRKPVQHEAALQRAVVEYLEARHLTFYAVPNGTKRGVIQAAYMKRQGVRAGAPDLVVWLPNGRTLNLELKAGKNGLSLAQKAMQAAAEVLGHEYRVCRTLDEVERAIERRAK